MHLVNDITNYSKLSEKKMHSLYDVIRKCIKLNFKHI